MGIFGQPSRRRVPEWIWDNKKTCAVILDELQHIAGRRYWKIIAGRERNWLESRVQAVRRRGDRPVNLSEMLASLLWHYFRLRWPMKDVSEQLGIPALTLHVKLRRISAIGRRLFPADSLAKQKPRPTKTKFPVEEIVRLREVKKMTWKQIAARVGGTLDGARMAYYVFTKKPLRPVLDGARIYELRKEGIGFKRIRKIIGANSHDAVGHAYRQYLKRTGMPDLPRPKCFAANKKT